MGKFRNAVDSIDPEVAGKKVFKATTLAFVTAGLLAGAVMSKDSIDLAVRYAAESYLYEQELNQKHKRNNLELQRAKHEVDVKKNSAELAIITNLMFATFAGGAIGATAGYGLGKLTKNGIRKLQKELSWNECKRIMNKNKKEHEARKLTELHTDVEIAKSVNSILTQG